MAPKTSKYIDDNSDEEDYKPGKDVKEEEEEFEEETKPEAKRQKRKREEPNTTTASTGSTSSETPRDTQGNQYLELSAKRRVTIRAFSSGEPSVDIREVYRDKNTGELRPGKGICLPMAQWKKLKELIPAIDTAIERL
ncbi:uncharacterized protein BYT42DRAFT_587131 [Radiomyces spectabilis]|uniref:uncharacterized protein n=1 Tax=Radiomyces spectabilis TaxID=64574 RepID=UPI002221163D|nr:uncharacterized protein BYT42DRAFT_587131 [Radiomyces spectabilis]KAI8367693.1 hypothetical protein BYT42DRAFT_587131 [Radiomyces spectabilis]